MQAYRNAGGISPECGGGQHRACPGYYRMTHPCGCPCHQRPRQPLEPVGPAEPERPAAGLDPAVAPPRQAYRAVIHNSVLGWVGRANAREVTGEVVEALREAGYVVVWAENLAKPA